MRTLKLKSLPPATRLLVMLCAAVAVALVSFADTRVRKAVANGPMYPEKREDILKSLNRFYDAVTYTPPDQKLIATIVPHSAWGFCGQIDATAFKELQIGQYERVIVLAPSHAQGFEGCSVPAVEGFSIPLGLIPTDGSVIGKLNYSSLFTLRGVSYTNTRRSQLHETETSIENVLPFLLERMGPFFLIPVLVGDLKDLDGKISVPRIEAVADALRGIIDDKTLLVISTDFTHYGNDFSFRPFNKEIPENIEKLDREAFRLIMERDFEGFIEYLQKTNNPICGQAALLVLMKLLPPQAIGNVLGYTQSSAITKNENRSVSYAAINFYDPALPALPAQKQIIPAGVEITGAAAPLPTPKPGAESPAGPTTTEATPK